MPGHSTRPKNPKSFRQFVCEVNPKFRWFTHCEVAARVLQDVADGKRKRVMFFWPPRHGKSEEISRLFSAYFLYRYPDRWVSINSYAAELANTLSRAARDNYRTGGGKLKDDAAAMRHWETGSGGGLFAAGVGGPITGKGWHLGIIDDPLKNAEEAASEIIRNKQDEWYTSTFYTREEPWSDTDPDGALILIQTRWNEDDLAGRRLADERNDEEDDPERWHIVNFEAIKEEESQAFPVTCTVEADWRQPGEALCPERRPLEKLKRIAKRIGGYFFNALFQQRPSAREGSFFKVTKLEIVDALPAELDICRAWDLAATKKKHSAFTVGAKVGRDAKGYWYITDVRRGKWTPDEVEEAILQTAALDGTDVKIRLPQDPGQAGIAQASQLTRKLSGYTVRAAPITGDKETRAFGFAAQVNAGNVRLLRAAWNAEYIEELRQCPTGKYWDQIDSSADGFNELAEPVTFEIW